MLCCFKKCLSFSCLPESRKIPLILLFYWLPGWVLEWSGFHRVSEASSVSLLVALSHSYHIVQLKFSLLALCPVFSFLHFSLLPFPPYSMSAGSLGLRRPARAAVPGACCTAWSVCFLNCPGPRPGGKEQEVIGLERISLTH